MTKLRIVIEPDGSGGFHPAAGRLTHVGEPDGSRPARREVHEFAIPTGRGAVLEVRPGHYVVQAEFPSGQVVSDERLVVDAEASWMVRRAMGKPPRSPARASRRDFSRPSAGGMLGSAIPTVPAEHLAEPLVVAAARLDGETGWIEAPAYAPARPEKIGAAVVRTRATASAPSTHRYDIKLSAGTRGSTRPWIHMRLGRCTLMASLPFPLPHLGGRTSVSLREAPADLRAGALPELQWNGRLADVLAYAVRGRLREAALVLEAFDPAVRDRAPAVCPLVECVSLYVALGEDALAARGEWTSRARALVERHPDLPDAHVAFGRFLLRSAKREKDLVDAFDHLQAGFRLGIPFLTVAVQHLFAGLDALAPDFPDAAALRARAIPTLGTIVATSPFTLLRSYDRGGAREEA